MVLDRIIIFGAESDTGYRLAQLVTRHDLELLAVIRTEREKRMLEKLGAEVIIADPLDRAAMAAVFAGLEVSGTAVVAFIGGTPQLNSQGNINVIDAAAEAGVPRFFLTTSVGCGETVAALDPFVKAFIGKAIRAKNWAENRLKATSMEWTIIRSGGMTVRPGRGGPVLIDSPHVVGYINRTDLGDAVFAALVSDKTGHRALTAVDRGKATHTKGEPLVPAEL